MTTYSHPLLGTHPELQDVRSDLRTYSEFRHFYLPPENSDDPELRGRWTIDLTNIPFDPNSPTNTVDYFHTTSLVDAEEKAFDLIVNQCRPTPANTYDVEQIIASNAFSVGDEFAALSVLITRQSSLIATRTRRGRGNVVIVSRAAFKIMSAARSGTLVINPHYREADVISDSLVLAQHDWSALELVGTLNQYLNVYVNGLWQDDHPVIIGYKNNTSGKIGESDAGLMLLPNLDESFYLVLPKTHERSLMPWHDYYGTVGINL